MFRNQLSAVILLVLSMGVSAQQPADKTIASSAGRIENSTTSAADDRYRIGPADVLDIRIFNRPNLSRDAVRVEGNGMIRMPLIETEIQAACHTEGELARDIASRYARFYKNLQVDVFIKEYHSKQIAIIGAVNDQAGSNCNAASACSSFYLCQGTVAQSGADNQHCSFAGIIAVQRAGQL